MMKTILKSFVCALLLSSASSLHAATFTFEFPERTSRAEEIRAQLVIHTEGEQLNAVQGEITVPAGVEVTKIYDNDSAILLWVEKPSFNTKTRKVSFSGVTPGGISGDRTILTLALKATLSGEFNFVLANASSFKNDGIGNEIRIKPLQAVLSVGENISTTTPTVLDRVSPEPFIPVIATSPDIYENKAFVSFVAHDKESGIDHYEYKASFLNPGSEGWITVESPFELPKEALGKRVYIKAFDLAGNTRMASIPTPGYYANVAGGVIITVLIIICVLYIARRLFLR
jgi:hypothetical protein